MNIVLDMIEDIAQHLDVEGKSLTWFIFGSYLESPKLAKDIDLLVVYDCADSAKDVRRSLKDISIYRPIDLLLMTKDEETEFDFIQQQNAKKIFP